MGNLTFNPSQKEGEDVRAQIAAQEQVISILTARRDDLELFLEAEKATTRDLRDSLNREKDI